MYYDLKSFPAAKQLLSVNVVRVINLCCQDQRAAAAMTQTFIEHLHFAHSARVIVTTEGTLTSQVRGFKRAVLLLFYNTRRL